MKTLRFAVPAAVLLFVAACGSSYSTPNNPTPTPNPTPGANAVTIPSGAQSMGSSAYKPNPITVPVGTTVSWTNSDAIAHTVTSDGGVFNSNSLGPGGTFTYMFSTAGTFPYHCAIHPGMVGSVVVQ